MRLRSRVGVFRRDGEYFDYTFAEVRCAAPGILGAHPIRFRVSIESPADGVSLDPPSFGSSRGRLWWGIALHPHRKGIYIYIYIWMERFYLHMHMHICVDASCASNTSQPFESAQLALTGLTTAN
jgi:hypothetical protein